MGLRDERAQFMVRNNISFLLFLNAYGCMCFFASESLFCVLAE